MPDKTPRNPVGFADFQAQESQVMDLWFNENVDVFQGCRLSVKVNNILCRYRTVFQDLAIVETESLGKMLILDGVIMLTEFDECAYHEMIAHVPLLTHPGPETVLVIGGGDGGTVRECLKHPEVRQVDLCEIDEGVVKACRTHMPALASCFDDARVRILYEDGARFVMEHPCAYDVIIVDSTDPVGPAQILFQRKFYEDMKAALRPGGIAVAQCESLYYHPRTIRGVLSIVRSLYPVWGYYYTLVPTYPSGIIGFALCSLERDPLKDLSVERAGCLKNLRYYTPDIHRAAFALPRFGMDILS